MSQSNKNQDKLSLDALQMKLKVILKHKGIIVASAVGTFLVVSILISVFYPFVDDLRNDFVTKNSLPSGSNSGNAPFYRAGMLLALPVMFAFFVLFFASRALLFNFRRRVITHRILQEKENDIYKWLEKEYEIEKESLRGMISRMYVVYTSLICTIVSITLLVLVSELVSGEKESEAGFFSDAIIVIFVTHIPLVLFAWYQSATITHDIIRTISRILLMVAIVALTTVLWHLPATDHKGTLTYIIVLFAMAFTCVMLSTIAAGISHICSYVAKHFLKK